MTTLKEVAAMVATRFWEKVDVRGDGECWLWKASKNKHGYGKFGICYRTKKAHRVSWMLTYGDIPDGLCVCHRCDVPACVNPAHLFLGTFADNTHDMVAKGRGSKPPRTKPRFSDALIAEICAASGTQREVAMRFGVSKSFVGLLRSGKRSTAAHIDEVRR